MSDEHANLHPTPSRPTSGMQRLVENSLHWELKVRGSARICVLWVLNAITGTIKEHASCSTNFFCFLIFNINKCYI